MAIWRVISTMIFLWGIGVMPFSFFVEEGFFFGLESYQVRLLGLLAIIVGGLAPNAVPKEHTIK